MAAMKPEQGYSYAISQESERIKRRCFLVGDGKDEEGSNTEQKPLEEVVASVLAVTTPESVPKDDQAFLMLQGWVKNSPEDDIYRAVLGRVLGQAVAPDYEAAIVAELKKQGYLDRLCHLYNVTREPASESDVSGTEAEDQSSASQSQDSKVAQGSVSETATLAAWMRAVGHAYGFGPDSLAAPFVDQKEEDLAPEAQKAWFRRTGELPQSRRYAEQHKAEPHLVSCPTTYMQCRTCFLDDAMETFARKNPACNIVILGAGYGSRLYRLSLPSQAALYEVDSPATQQAKLSKLKKMDVSGRDRVQYVSCDFRTQRWADVLLSTGLDVSRPTFVLWEGVTYYLPPEVVMDTIKEVGQGALSKAPTLLALDYASPAQKEHSNKYMQRIREPWLFAADADDMEARMVESGLKVIDHCSNSEVQSRYMPRKPDGSSVGFAATHKSLMVVCNQKAQDAQVC